MRAAAQRGEYVVPDDVPFMVAARTGRPPKGVRFGANLPVGELSLPAAIDQFGEADYASAVIGKWHLTSRTPGWLEHPTKLGFEHFNGTMSGGLENYYNYQKVTNGAEMGLATGYSTSHQIEDALGWIESLEGGQP